MQKEKLKILVVDDSPTMRRIAVNMLKDRGFGSVDEAGDGREALECLTEGDKYDLVCTDWNMPEMNGIEMLEEIRKHPEIGELPVIMLTTRNMDRDVAQAVQAGVSDYLVKPFKPTQLVKKIEKVLTSGRFRMSDVYKTDDPDLLFKATTPSILAQEEIDALLSATDTMEKEGQEMADKMEKAMDDQEKAKPPSSATPDGRIVTGYDFKHPARVNKDQLRTLENLHDNFARLLCSTFSGAMRAVVDVDTAFVDQTTYAEFIMSLSNPACSYEFTLGPTKGRAIIDVAMPVVFSFVDRIFGGKGSSQGVDARQLTPIEIGVINRIARRVIEDLEATWEPILPVEITDIELETNPEFMQITAASEIVILLAFEVNSTNASGLVSLCYPFFTLESILPRLGQQTFVRRSEESREELRLNNRLRLGRMQVPVVAELGRTQISLNQANSLQPGDIMRLPARATDPATVYLGGTPKYLARPFAEKDGELKLKVVDEVPVDLQRKYGRVPTDAESV